MPDMDGCSVLDQLLRARPDQMVMVLSVAMSPPRSAAWNAARRTT